ncbi:MAG: hypothetical protein ACI3YH_07065 [Eubacteriales bacterium]
MEDKNTNESFSFTYSAKEQKEIRSIREKYAPTTAGGDKGRMMEQLRALDRSVTRKGTAISLVMGIAGVLLLGFGMSCCMVWMSKWLIPGIIIGLLGIAFAALSYPVYVAVTKKERERIAPEILRLSDELLK